MAPQTPTNDGLHPEPTAHHNAHPEWDCLLVAARRGDASSVERILKEHPSSASHTNPLGRSALHFAAWWGRVGCVGALLARGANANASADGSTPLHECLASSAVRRSAKHRRNRIECAERLLSAGADPGRPDGESGTPLGCLVVVSPDDARDLEELRGLFSERVRATESPLVALREALGSGERGLDEIDRLWSERIAPGRNPEEGPAVDLESAAALLSAELPAMARDWVDEVETLTEQGAQTPAVDGVDHDHRSGRIAWVWKRLAGLPVGPEGETDRFKTVRESVLGILCTGIFHRYEHLYRARRSAGNEPPPSLLRDDATLSSWTETAALLVPEVDGSASSRTAQDSPGRNNDNNEARQAWIAIARRDYFELAVLWWDRFGIGPIGVVNRQGMSPLHFAARSGHLRMVRWFLRHPSLAVEERPSDWVGHKDQRGQTALMAATSNQHGLVADLLQDYTDST